MTSRATFKSTLRQCLFQVVRPLLRWLADAEERGQSHHDDDPEYIEFDHLIDDTCGIEASLIDALETADYGPDDYRALIRWIYANHPEEHVDGWRLSEILPTSSDAVLLASAIKELRYTRADFAQLMFELPYLLPGCETRAANDPVRISLETRNSLLEEVFIKVGLQGVDADRLTKLVVSLLQQAKSISGALEEYDAIADLLRQHLLVSESSQVERDFMLLEQESAALERYRATKERLADFRARLSVVQ